MALNRNFTTFRKEKKEMNLDKKAPKAASHHLSAATTNTHYELEIGLLKQKKATEKFYHSLF